MAFWQCGMAFGLGPIYFSAVAAVAVMFIRHLWLISIAIHAMFRGLQPE